MPDADGMVLAALMAGIHGDRDQLVAYVGQVEDTDLRSVVETVVGAAGLMVRLAVGVDRSPQEVAEFARAAAVWWRGKDDDAGWSEATDE